MGDSVLVALLGLVFMTNPNKSSFGENFSARSSLRFWLFLQSGLASFLASYPLTFCQCPCYQGLGHRAAWVCGGKVYLFLRPNRSPMANMRAQHEFLFPIYHITHTPPCCWNAFLHLTWRFLREWRLGRSFLGCQLWSLSCWQFCVCSQRRVVRRCLGITQLCGIHLSLSVVIGSHPPIVQMGVI